MVLMVLSYGASAGQVLPLQQPSELRAEVAEMWIGTAEALEG